MRIFLGLWILFSTCSAMAIEARVLIDETSAVKTLMGDLRLKCLRAQNKTCQGKTYLLPNGQWQVERVGQLLKITNLTNKTFSKLEGSHFKFTGNFSVDGKNMQRLDLVFEKNKTDWVAHFPVDQYLYGVMGAEVPASWPLEALKAQAVASRTYFLFKKLERKQEHYDVRSDIMDQVFSMDAQKHKNIMQAVDDTHDMILVNKEGGEVFPAYFHSDCGGQTTNESLVWREPSSLNQSVKDPFCQTASKNNWSYGIDKQELIGLLQKAFYLPAGVSLVSILPRFNEEARSHIVDFLFSKNILKRIRANDLRRLLGFGRLKSTQFEISETWNQVVFTGRGFGHGVGMCQWGAQRWARKGKDYRSILGHYYPQSELQKLDPTQLQAQMVF